MWKIQRFAGIDLGAIWNVVVDILYFQAYLISRFKIRDFIFCYRASIAWNIYIMLLLVGSFCATGVLSVASIQCLCSRQPRS